VSYCAAIGGKNTQSVVRGILARLFAPELAVCVNYTGTSGKTAFEVLKLKEVLFSKSSIIIYIMLNCSIRRPITV
jgi:hypothetical protein